MSEPGPDSFNLGDVVRQHGVLAAHDQHEQHEGEHQEEEDDEDAQGRDLQGHHDGTLECGTFYKQRCRLAEDRLSTSRFVEGLPMTGSVGFFLSPVNLIFDIRLC